MVTPLPIQFRKSPPSVATYSFTEILTGVGNIIFYGVKQETSTGPTYNLITNQVFSRSVSTTQAGTGTTTMNFDSQELLKPIVVKGDLIFSAGMGAEHAGTVKILVQVKKWDGSSETNLSSEIESQQFATSPSPDTFSMVLMTIPLTTTTIKKGEQVRITVKLVLVAGGNGEFAHSPKNLDGRWVVPTTQNSSTTMQVFLPVKTDLS